MGNHSDSGELMDANTYQALLEAQVQLRHFRRFAYDQDQRIIQLEKQRKELSDEIALRNKENDKLKAEREEYLPIDWCIREGKSGIPKAFSLKDTTGQTLGEYIDRLKSNADTHLDLLKKQQAKCKELQAKYDELMNSYGVAFRENDTPTIFQVDDKMYRFENSAEMAFKIMEMHIRLKNAEQDPNSWRDHFYYQSKQ